MSSYADRTTFNTQFRTSLAGGIVLLICTCLLVRLWYLQVMHGSSFREQSENNRLRRVYVPAPRGLVFDRNGKVLVRNRPSFSVDLVSEDSPDPVQTIRALAEIVNVDADILLQRQGVQKRRHRFEPRQLLRDVSRDTMARVMARRYELPGITIDVDPAREYVYGSTAAHVLGYIREISKSQLENQNFKGYRAGDMVGQFGLEAKLEPILQGQRGVQNVIVNALGTKIGEYSFQPENPGRNVITTLDLEVQQAAESALQSQAGSIVAMDPRNGEILALTSSPAFDPNIFAGEVPVEVWRDLTTGKRKVMQNRPIQGGYPPASVFKIFTAIAGLSEGVITQQDRVYCQGYYAFAGRNYRCHKHSGHGWVNLRDAMAQSCDVYFYSLGQKLGVDRIAEYAGRFGLGRPTGLGLGEENPGLVPSSAWKRRAYKGTSEERWYPGETLSVAIGQGALVVTPLQVARSVSSVINGGSLIKPTLLKSIESQDLAERARLELSSIESVPVSHKTLEVIRESLIAVVHDPKGTGGRAKLPVEFGIEVGGKTGTAQVVSLSVANKQSHMEDHAWFVGFAPAREPEILVVAMVENGGHGGVAAAPAAQQVMQAYFQSRFPGLAVTDEGENLR